MRRPPSSSIPDGPGVYLFKDGDGRVLYVGKAKSLRKRLANYFSGDLAPRTAAMVASAAGVDWIVTDNEVAALMLEYSLAQEHSPRFNVRLRDDKTFPFLALSVAEEWPRAWVTRSRRAKTVRYFGPYAHAYAIRDTLDLLLRTFPVRTCTDSKFRTHAAQGRPCLLFDIGRCAGPCIGAVEEDEYRSFVDGLAAFLDGDGADVIAGLREHMLAASGELAYERAARFRDRLQAVERALARQELVSQRPETFDLVALDEDELEAAVVVLNVKHGRVTGRRTTIIDKVEDLDTSTLMARVVSQLYGAAEPPPMVLLQVEPDDGPLLEQWLRERRGGRVTVRVPQRGAKRRLMDTASANAREAFARHRLRRTTDHNARARALRGLQHHLALEEPPLRIECYDISTIQGTDTVGSMVVFEDAVAKKSQYRRFRVKTIDGQDDFAAMEEVLRRRLTAYLVDRERPVDERGRFAYPPSLIVIDGGAGQLGRAVKVLRELDLDIAVIGLAKRLEEVYVPGGAEPLVIPRGDEALYLLQRVRDEAHRFAVSYHRTLRRKRMVDSALDAVPGVGPVRKRKLIAAFGSVKKMRNASVEELAGHVPETVAVNVYEALRGEPSR